MTKTKAAAASQRKTIRSTPSNVTAITVQKDRKIEALKMELSKQKRSNVKSQKPL